MPKIKKIAIATNQMVMGGIEKSLIELCRVLVQQGHDVTLFLNALGGELFDEIPKEVKIVHIFQGYTDFKSIFVNSLHTFRFKAAISALKACLINKFHGDPVEGWIATTGYLDTSSDYYDYAFAYGAPISFSVIFVRNVINSSKKYTWIHNEVNQISLDITKYKYIFADFDKIICVSKKALDTLVVAVPELKSKAMVFYNIINKEKIHFLSQLSNFDIKKNVNILTVGRLCQQKGQDIIPELAKQLTILGYQFRWYCVGDGELYVTLMQKIHAMGLDDIVILLGSVKNPYPYFRNADLYVQPSRHEGFGITLAEAKLFHLPIIATNFDGASEQIVDGKTGLIVPFDKTAMLNAIIYLLKNPRIAQEFSENLKHDKKSCTSKIENLLEEDN